MLYEFVDEFKGVKIGDEIKVKKGCLPPYLPGHIPVPSDFILYIRMFTNRFTVRTIQEIDDNSVMIGVDEVGGVLEYPQIQVYSNSLRIINSGAP